MNTILTRQRPWVYLTLALAPALPIAAMSLLLAQAGKPDWTLLVAWCVWAAMLGSLYIRRLDETARAAQRWAWEWGGAGGLGAALVLALFGWYLSPGLAEAFAGAVRAQSSQPEATAFLWGVGFATVCAFTGFGLAWAGWWLSKRGGGG